MTYKIVVLGASLGGVRALHVLLAGLPNHFPLPVAVVLHRGSDSDDTLRAVLQKESALRVKEAEDKEIIQPGLVYLSPADYHLLIEAGSLALSTDAPVAYARPSINVLFESAAEAYGVEAIGVVLTGASRDGAQGLAKIKERGGFAIVQEPATAESAVMPRAAIAASKVDRVLPISKIAPFLVYLVNQR